MRRCVGNRDRTSVEVYNPRIAPWSSRFAFRDDFPTAYDRSPFFAQSVNATVALFERPQASSPRICSTSSPFIEIRLARAPATFSMSARRVDTVSVASAFSCSSSALSSGNARSFRICQYLIVSRVFSGCPATFGPEAQRATGARPGKCCPFSRGPGTFGEVTQRAIASRPFAGERAFERARVWNREFP